MTDQPRIYVHILSWRAHPNTWLVQWLAEHNLNWVRSDQSIKDIDVNLNSAIRRYLLNPDGCEFFMSINGDIVPTRSTQNILIRHEPLLYCGDVAHGGGRGHFGDGEFGFGCFRARIDLLRNMELPWFKRMVNENSSMVGKTWDELGDFSPPVSELVGCECLHFRQRAEQLGVRSRMAGIVGNQQGDAGPVILPDPESERGYKLVTPQEVDSNILRQQLPFKRPYSAAPINRIIEALTPAEKAETNGAAANNQPDDRGRASVD